MIPKRKLIYSVFLLLILCLAKAGFCDKALPDSKSPELIAVRFYALYMHALNQNIYPLETDRKAVKEYVTERLIREIDQMPTGPDGLDGDYFVDAQEWDPAWEKNITVLKTVKEGGRAIVDLMLTGPQNPSHKLRVTLTEENKNWKIDKVETGK